jgi:hypothetical protein
MGWTDLAQDREKQQAAVNIVTDLYLLPYNGGAL